MNSYFFAYYSNPKTENTNLMPTITTIFTLSIFGLWY